ncbi:MAG: TraR/DksA C4-type zinc finger protein [Bryobacteraceae bacterium]|jgi:DnaK suppressor protein
MNSAKTVLREKERELLSDLARLEDEAREPTDEAATDQSSAEALEEVTMESRTLEQVQDALKRVDDHTYGKCIICGHPIEPARLQAIPWTPYCLEDQEKQGIAV